MSDETRDGDSWWRYKPTIKTTNGLIVPNPSAVNKTGKGQILLENCLKNSSAGVASRGRRYAKIGQVIELEIKAQQLKGLVQGGEETPYQVKLWVNGRKRRGVTATCTCGFGCNNLSWCKHAVAMAYVGAHVLDSDPRVAARFEAEQEPEGVANEETEEGVERQPEQKPGVSTPDLTRTLYQGRVETTAQVVREALTVKTNPDTTKMVAAARKELAWPEALEKAIASTAGEPASAEPTSAEPASAEPTPGES